MHRFPDQHFPSLLCPRLNATHPLDNCGDLLAVKTSVSKSLETADTVGTDPEGAGHDYQFRCQYENKSRSGLLFRAEEPAIPFLSARKRGKLYDFFFNN